MRIGFCCRVTLCAASLLMPVFMAHADQLCDFDKPTGTCVGTIELQRSGGSNKSYSAEIQVRSSSPRCSKVEYFVDHTPYTTVLQNKNSEPESLFGTHPIKKESIQVSKCTTYPAVGKASGEVDHSKGTAVTSRDFTGEWTGSLRWTFISSPVVLNIVANGNHVTGTSLDVKLNYSVPVDGTISGNKMTFTFNQRDQGTAQGELVLTSPTTATYSTMGSGITFSGVVRKQ